MSQNLVINKNKLIKEDIFCKDIGKLIPINKTDNL